jgi:hypothetical protein
MELSSRRVRQDRLAALPAAARFQIMSRMGRKLLRKLRDLVAGGNFHLLITSICNNVTKVKSGFHMEAMLS